MSNQTLALVLGLAVISVVGVLLWRLISRRGSGSWKVSIAQLFESEFTVGPNQKREVEESIATATRLRNLPASGPVAPALPAKIRIRRILWVDDNPDNNVYETIALESLGMVITKTTTSKAAFDYLNAQHYQLVITDLGRPADPLAGLDFVASVKGSFPDARVLVYTMDAASSASEGTTAGAFAVVDTPRDLLAAVLSAMS